LFQTESETDSNDEDYCPRKETNRRRISKAGRPTQKGRRKISGSVVSVTKKKPHLLGWLVLAIKKQIGLVAAIRQPCDGIMMFVLRAESE